MSNKQFGNKIPEDNVFANSILKQNEEKKAEADKRNKNYTSSFKNEFRIERWSHADCFDRLPTVANLLYVPAAVIGMEDQLSTGDVDYSLMPRLLFQRLQEIGEFREFLEDLLDQTYLIGEDTPVHFEESFESPMEIIEVVVEVLRANFMMDLCAAMLAATPSLMDAGALQETLTKQSIPETSTKQ